MKWYAERKFNFGEIANFQEPRPPANIRPQRIEQAGGSRKNFAAPASKKARPRAGFCGGLAPHTVAARLYFPPRRGICRLGATNPFKAAFRFLRACEEKSAKRSVLKRLVARSARRCAAFDPGGFGSASSRDITPMCHAVRASSPNVMAHAVARHSGVSEYRRPLVGCFLKARITGISAGGVPCFSSFYGRHLWASRRGVGYHVHR